MLDFLNTSFNEPKAKSKRKPTIGRRLPNNRKLEKLIADTVKDGQVTSTEAKILKSQLEKSKVSARFRTQKELKKLSRILEIQGRGLGRVLEQKEKGRVIAALNTVITSTKKDVNTILSNGDKNKKKENIKTVEKKGISPSKNISSNGILKGIGRLALHDILDAKAHPTVKITLSKNSVYKSYMDGKTYTVSYRNGRYRFANGRRVLIGNGDRLWGVSKTENNPKDKENTVVSKSIKEEQKKNTEETQIKEEKEVVSTKLAQELSSFIQRKGPYKKRGKNSCGAAVGTLLNRFGIQGLPTSGRHGYKWVEFLNERPKQFKKIKINHPSEAPDGAIVTYGKNAQYGSRARKRYGHVEICSKKRFVSYYNGSYSAGSSVKGYAAKLGKGPRGIDSRLRKNPNLYKKITAFDGYAFVPINKKT